MEYVRITNMTDTSEASFTMLQARPVFGLEFFRVNDQPQPVLGANMDVIGIVGPCSTADPQSYPLDTPVLIYSNDVVALSKLGDGTGFFDGYLADAINGINAQLADFQVAAQVVIVRTAYGTATDANIKLQQTIANIMGQSVMGNGIWALLKAPSMLYCTPRIILCPGYTGQMANSLDTLHTNVFGTGYIPGATYTITFQQGVGETNGAQLVLPAAHAVANMFGEIHDTELFIDSFGAWMTAAPVATLTPPDGAPIQALAASGSIIFQREPGIGSTITLNGKIITFVSGTPTGLQVQLSGDLSTTLSRLQSFLSGSADTTIDDNTYSVTAGTLLMVQKATGAAGNAYTLTTTVTGASLSGSHLTGGQDAQAPAQATLTATIALGANPICSMLPGVLDGLIAHAVVESAGTGQIADQNWRTTLNHTRLIGLSGGVKVLDPISGNVIVQPLAPRVAGLIVAVDFSTGYPFHSPANRAIQGIVGPARTINFSLTDGATEGQQLLASNLGIIARGLIGVETAISSGGFVFIGTDNLGDDELWRMLNVTRGRDYIHLSLMPALRTYLGRQNITRQTIKNVLTTINNFLGTLVAQEQILGKDVSFKGSLNSADEIRLGHLVVGFACEEAPVLKRITTMSARYKPAIDTLVQSLEQELNLGQAA
jgi:phage tail sheath protein FI